MAFEERLCVLPREGLDGKGVGVRQQHHEQGVKPQRFTYRPAVQTETCRPLCVLMSSTVAARLGHPYAFLGLVEPVGGVI